MRNIQYIIFHKIDQSAEHPEGKEIIDIIFEALRLGGYPREGEIPSIDKPHSFGFAKADRLLSFHALLISAPGKIVTQLLSEHRGDLGQCRVVDIMVFAEGTRDQRRNRQNVRPTLVFEIEDWPGETFTAGSRPGAGSRPFATTGRGAGDGGGGGVYHLPGRAPMLVEQKL